MRVLILGCNQSMGTEIPKEVCTNVVISLNGINQIIPTVPETTVVTKLTII